MRSNPISRLEFISVDNIHPLLQKSTDEDIELITWWFKNKYPSKLDPLRYFSPSLKTKKELSVMREVGIITAQILDYLTDIIIPGMTTLDINYIVGELIDKSAATSAMIGFIVDGKPWQHFCCTSVNNEVGHGVPSKRKLKNGDIVSVDLCLDYLGWKSDSARTYSVGEISTIAESLIEVTKQSLNAAINQMVVGNYLIDVQKAMQSVIESSGFSLVMDYSGHGIGREIHELPHVSHWYVVDNFCPLLPGLVLAIEPMVNIGQCDVRNKRNGTIITADGSLSAHFEHTIAITKDGPWILTESSSY
jgi:methionyl aminopeptidase